LRRAADAGSLDAMYSLGMLLHESGRLDAAERGLPASSDAGDIESLHNLGVLLDETGRPDKPSNACERPPPPATSPP
jgi:TPR repeat protein